MTSGIGWQLNQERLTKLASTFICQQWIITRTCTLKKKLFSLWHQGSNCHIQKLHLNHSTEICRIWFYLKF